MDWGNNLWKNGDFFFQELQEEYFHIAVTRNKVRNLDEISSKDIDYNKILLSGKANEVADTSSKGEQL